jgi:hypothetical protein
MFITKVIENKRIYCLILFVPTPRLQSHRSASTVNAIEQNIKHSRNTPNMGSPRPKTEIAKAVPQTTTMLASQYITSDTNVILQSIEGG